MNFYKEVLLRVLGDRSDPLYREAVVSFVDDWRHLLETVLLELQPEWLESPSGLRILEHSRPLCCPLRRVALPRMSSFAIDGNGPQAHLTQGQSVSLGPMFGDQASAFVRLSLNNGLLVQETLPALTQLGVSPATTQWPLRALQEEKAILTIAADTFSIGLAIAHPEESGVRLALAVSVALPLPDCGHVCQS